MWSNFNDHIYKKNVLLSWLYAVYDYSIWRLDLNVNLDISSAVKRLIIQNKSFCLHNICMCAVYIYYVYINTHVYISENILFIY